MSHGEHKLDYTSPATGDHGRNSFIVGIVLIVVDSSAWAYYRAARDSEFLLTLLAFLVAWLLSLLFGIWGVMSGLRGLRQVGNPRRYAVVGLVINFPLAAVALYYAARWLHAA